jgi:pilus assembly protein CpaC
MAIGGLTALLVALALPVEAQDTSKIHVSVGEAVSIQVDNVAKVAISDPQVADFVPLSEKELSVIGKKPGVATLSVVKTEGRPTQVYRIEVGNEQAATVIRQMVGHSDVRVRSVGDMIILDGRVENEIQADRAVKVATAFKEKVINLLEVASPRQVRIRTRLVEVRNDDVKNLGIEYFGQNGQVKYGFGRISVSEPDSGSVAVHGFMRPVSATTGELTENTAGVEATLNLLLSKNYARLLSEPTLVTLSGQEASFLSGGEVPIVSQLADSFNVQYKEFGVRMKIKPTVDSEGKIHTLVLAEVSDINPNVVVNNVPSFLTRRAETAVSVRDGQTIVIGGLIRNNLGDSMRKFPWLADVPVLGALFRSKDFRNNQSELLVFVTPELVKDINQETANSVKTPLMKEWNDGKATENMLPVPDPKDDWGMHRPDRMGAK